FSTIALCAASCFIDRPSCAASPYASHRACPGLGLATKERYTNTCALYPRSQERSLTAHLVTSRAGTLRSMPDHGSWLSTISPIPPVTFRRIVAGDFP